MMTGILRFPSIMRITELNRVSLDKYIRSVGVRQIRLACGLVLFAYLLSHFINHALGNISLDALATGVRYHTAFWKSLPITTVFYAAAAAHAGLGLLALYQRRQFHWKAIEPIQLVLGLSIPALIITHLAGVRFDEVLFQHQKLYPQVFYSYWIIWPYKMWLMFCSDRILGSRLHWTVFLAPNEGVLQDGSAVSAGGSGTHSDACHARPLSGRTKGRA